MPEADPVPDPFARVVAALRETQDLANGADAPDPVLSDVASLLAGVNDLLRPHVVPGGTAPAGRRNDLPGRGHTLLLPFVVEEDTELRVSGRVHFPDFYYGGNGAAHGGTLGLFFDEVLGRLSNSHGRTIARTAYLHVNYRQITPIGPELRVEGTFDRQEGRKRWLSGRLYHGDDVVADAEGLWVTLLPGQP